MALFLFWFKLDLTAGNRLRLLHRLTEAMGVAPDPALDRARHALRRDLPRMVRGSLLDTLGEDYIRHARAKGCPSGA